jgi:hypothetical protein
MLTLSMRLAIGLRTLLHYAPTNILLRWLRTRNGLKWGVPFMTLGAAYLLASVALGALIRNGGAGWLNVLVLLCMWDGVKLAAFGPLSLVLLTRVRIREHRNRPVGGRAPSPAFAYEQRERSRLRVSATCHLTVQRSLSRGRDFAGPLLTRPAQAQECRPKPIECLGNSHWV